MQKLIQFLKKFRDFLIFFVLQVLALTTFINSKNFHRSKMTNTSSNVIGWFLEKKHSISKHFSLEESNQILMDYNAKLLEQLPTSFHQLQSEIFIVNDTLKRQKFQYIAATVINSSDNKRNNYFTLNQGSVQGVEIGMGVISDKGVIGEVVDVSSNFAMVMTVLTEKIRVNVKLKKNNEYWLLSWDGMDSDFAQIQQVKRDVPFEIGDEVVTRGGLAKFPEGIPVGTIEKVISKDGEQTISLNIELTVNYNAVYHVYVVKNIMKQEQLDLEAPYLDNE